MQNIFQLQKCKQKLSFAIVQTKLVSCKLCTQKLSQLWRNFAIFLISTLARLSPLQLPLFFVALSITICWSNWLSIHIYIAQNIRKYLNDFNKKDSIWCNPFITFDLSREEKITKLRQSCDSFCVHNMQETTFVCTIATDNFCMQNCNWNYSSC